MALTEVGQEGIIYLSTYDGYIKRNVDEHVEGAKKRTDKKGRIIYEKFYKKISGLLTRLETTQHEEYGKFWNIHLRDNLANETYVFQIPFSSRYTDGFLRRLPNIEIKEPIEIICGKYDEKAYLVVHQHGSKVPYFWTKEDPKKLPPMVEVTLKGEKIWDDTAKMEYLEKYVNEIIVPGLAIAYPVENLQNHDIPPANNISKPEEPEFPTKDDLPF